MEFEKEIKSKKLRRKSVNKSIWDISYELEKVLEKYFKCKFDHTGTIFDRDVIQKEMFYDVMALLLYMYGGDGSLDFLDKYYKYKKIDMEKIPDYENIFEEFKALLIK